MESSDSCRTKFVIPVYPSVTGSHCRNIESIALHAYSDLLMTIYSQTMHEPKLPE
jgi:hypothetical protein